MKIINIILLCLFTTALIACSDSSNTSAPSNKEVTTNEPATITAEPAASATEKQDAVVASAASESDVMTLGKQVYMRNCVACHQPNGKGIPPAFPSIAGSEVVTGDKDGQILLILNGVPGTAMVAFGQQISDEEIAAVITYQRNSFGNNTGDEVTAAQVKALR